ncbi:hypothetical protein J2795_002072 [Chryseobacterium bernardetii]|jgi:hypothetical protein|uniref:Uncharacterized protein n=1 Tax=Chryseobacterium bernardetii TaxID=1241978 RepID=A0ACC6IUM3_9FLAO|nr:MULTISPECIES: hypothetical protein [Chryseobacterium]MBP1164628.1 hypothetical protein [Chryseobacterium sp. PvR013]MDR6370882.1 hypothetical protein [Chryseobacterium vietnamense]MDR6441372.1 hypothetical protein [Chryseobacterium bernardetii]MDR6461565.1 hypothetical protein [Chryseobacterium sediminis]
MNFNQALQHKKEILKSLGELRKFNDAEIMILPFKAEDFQRYMDEYRKDPKKFNDQSCIKFSTDNKYMVYRMCKDQILNCR